VFNDLLWSKTDWNHWMVLQSCNWIWSVVTICSFNLFH